MSEPHDSERQPVTGLHINSDQVVGREGGFLAIRRLRLQNRRADGSRSDEYLCDFVVRPVGLDAVVVVAYHQGRRGVEVLLRDGLRPALALGRHQQPMPIADDRSYLFLTELVAGIVEVDDVGEEGLRQRAAAELLEEAGYRADPASFVRLGGGSFPSPGAMSEKFWLLAVEVFDKAAHLPIEGDGSPMEEDAVIRWMDLGTAIADCVAGNIEDAKTELGLRRLRDYLEAIGDAGDEAAVAQTPRGRLDEEG